MDPSTSNLYPSLDDLRNTSFPPDLTQQFNYERPSSSASNKRPDEDVNLRRNTSNNSGMCIIDDYDEFEDVNSTNSSATRSSFSTINNNNNNSNNNSMYNNSSKYDVDDEEGLLLEVKPMGEEPSFVNAVAPSATSKSTGDSGSMSRSNSSNSLAGSLIIDDYDPEPAPEENVMYPKSKSEAGFIYFF